jgi:dihydroneopterin aldolase
VDRHRADTIRLSGIAAVGFHGVFEHEQRNGQPFLVDVVLHTDVAAAAATDDLALTANYGEVAGEVRDLITGDICNLIETLAERIAARILARFQVAAVEVTVHKPRAPIEVTFADVAVSIYRERP